MGTTLTGTTPQDTYDSLIKVTDNGPLSGTAKYLSDGLGNDSTLALSTGNIGIGTSSPTDTVGYGRALDIQSSTGAVIYLRDSDAPTTQYGFLAFDGADNGLKLQNANSSGFLRFDTNATEKMRITSAGNVGIGTSAPNIGGYVAGNTVLTMAPSGSDKFSVLQLSGNRGFGGNQNGNIDFVNREGTATITSRISAINGASALDGQIAFETRTSAGSLTEKVRILSTGGITFNGDTAAANALDDYEEGTWTPTFDSATISGTPTGKYTKVGRTVYATCTFTYTDLTGADINVSGLPFTNGAIRQATVNAYSGIVRTTNQFFGIVVEASANNFYIEVVNSASGVNLTAHASCWYQV